MKDMVFCKNGKLNDNSLKNIKLLCPNCFLFKENKGIYIQVKVKWVYVLIVAEDSKKKKFRKV